MINQIWVEHLSRIITSGSVAGPHGKVTLELPQQTLCVDMLNPVITNKNRRLNYQFMAAEAYWILSADNTIAGIAPWNKHIAKFSDNGETFSGAYGPRIADQLDYVVGKLVEDRDSRQACLTIWKENPPDSKDIPCTIAVVAQIRHDQLNLHVFMRSSDAWLGVPYDIFNFAMLGHLITYKLRQSLYTANVVPGQLFLTMASAHLYDTNVDAAKTLIMNNVYHNPVPDVPSHYHTGDPRKYLAYLRNTKPGDSLRWWEQ